MDIKDKYTISHVSEKLGVSDATLRKYEKDYKIKVPRNELGHRFYTVNEIEILEQIIKLKEQGANIHVINRIMARSESFEEQNEQALELVTLDKLTGAEFKELMMKQIAEIIIKSEKELTQKYEEKLYKVKDELKEDIKQEFKRQQEQREVENQKLMNYIAATKEEKKKRFWNIFKK